MGNTMTCTDPSLNTVPGLDFSCDVACRDAGTSECVVPYPSTPSCALFAPDEVLADLHRKKFVGCPMREPTMDFFDFEPLLEEELEQGQFFLCADGRPMRDRGIEIGQDQQPPVTALLAKPTAPLVLHSKDVLLMPAEIENHSLSCRLAWKAKGERPAFCLSACICFGINRSTLENRALSWVHFRKDIDSINGITYKKTKKELSVQTEGIEGRAEFDFKLSSMRQDVHVVFFVVATCAEDDGDRADVTGFHLNVVERASEKELISFERLNDTSTSGFALAMFIRDGTDWYFVAFDEAFDMGNAVIDHGLNVGKLLNENTLKTIRMKLIGSASEPVLESVPGFPIVL
eukprot:gnl/TRDRNA2_/TRDRNA2_146662_c0_seq6.p1 gnl/TRDRNA2_/TRDRNA2_146662_c0~~gnl/TRDRNA2_/TRDRNA2_146662_c0_seq6.p1  ORF type:complete len:346 (+),score=42.83 gnl/TRDRNA2_/TRDRNA2_146662_c0_seq6:65-1102(+)